MIKEKLTAEDVGYTSYASEYLHKATSLDKDITIVVKISPDGSLVALYSDDVAEMLEDIRADITECARASDVYWDHDRSMWKVEFRPPFDHIPPGYFKLRKDALEWEKEILQEELSKEIPLSL